MLERHWSWQYFIFWTSEMAARYGGTVWENGKQWDWGQAIYREMYGPNWMKDKGFQEMDRIPVNQPAPIEIIRRCQDWRKGNWPDWVDRDKMQEE